MSYPDIFFKREEADEDWTLFDPADARLLTETYGEEFEKEYVRLEEEYKKDPSKFNPNTKVVKSRDILRYHMLSMVEFGGPFFMFKDTINNAHKHPDAGIIRSSNLCVSGDTNILTRLYGNIPIGDLVENQVIETECWNGEKWSKTKLFKTSHKQEVLTVKLSNHNEIKATPYHRWLVKSKNGDIVVETKDLKPGMCLVTHNPSSVIEHGNKTCESARSMGEKFVHAKNNFKRYVLSNSYTLKTRLTWLSGVLNSAGMLKTEYGYNILYFNKYRKNINYLYLFLQELGIISNIIKTTRADIHDELGPYYHFGFDGEDGTVKDEIYYSLTIDEYGCNQLLELGYSSVLLHTDTIVPVLFKSSVKPKLERIVKVVDVVCDNLQTATYCGSEPELNRLVFNGQLTMNCTEVVLPTSNDLTGVCNLGSINLARVENDEELESIVKMAVRVLDNNIDLTCYPSESSRNFQTLFRSIGIGSLGEAEWLANKQVYYGSDEHKKLIDNIWDIIERVSYSASVSLAEEKGACKAYATGQVKEKIRNAYRLAIAPNSSSAIMAGTTNGIEPVYDKIWMEENKRGGFIMTAPHININNYPYYQNPYEIDPLKQIEVNAIRQKHIDMSISMNLFLDPDGLSLKRIRECIVHAWKNKLKTIYYLRSKPPKKTEFKEDKISCVGCVN